MDRDDRTVDDFERRDTELGIATAQAQHPPLADCLRRNDVRSAFTGALVDTGSDLLWLPRSRTLQLHPVCKGQAAARVSCCDLAIGRAMETVA